MEILTPHCKDDASLGEDVCQFVRTAKSEDLDVKAQINVLPFEELEAPIPDRIGEYRVVSVLGAGGMGIVYAAEFKGQDMEARPVALKVAKDGSHAEAVMRRLRAEINLLSRLHHPNIVQIYNAGTTESGKPYLVIELVEGGVRLNDYFSSQGSAIEKRVSLFQKVCSAVQYLHDRNIVHRDLTPGNILVNKTGEPKILDFGLAVFLKPVDDAPSYANSEETPRRLGTPGYMSPEQARHEPGRISDDVWALGKVLDVLISNASLASPGSARLKAALQQIVAACHEPTLSKRIQSAGELAERLEQAVADANAHAATRLLRLAQSTKGRLVAAFAILLAVLAAGSWYRDFRRTQETKKREEANILHALKMKADSEELAIKVFKAPYEGLLAPLTRRSGALEKQVEYASQLAEAGDWTAKGIFGITMVTCRGDTLVARDQIDPQMKESERQTSQRVIQELLSICSESNAEKGFAWLEESAKNGQAALAAFLAQAFYEGMGGRQKDPKRALHWANKAIQGSHPHGYRVLGQLYYEGNAVPANEELAIANWEKAANYGDVLSQYRMAATFKYGRLPRWPRNYAEAYKWALLSAANSQGLVTGTGINRPESDLHEDIRQGALKLRAEMESMLTPEQRDAVQREAAHWLPLKFHPTTIKFSSQDHEAIRRAVLGDEPSAKSNQK